ncbi:hypothetical protein [Sandarakinorhabdus sp.]|jgi:hypothetical protein|uniref:hypothetical protein n=1 Tax=Sandarakinorhabdus sp. TaxID=1916663 RepID=UPI00356322DC
MAISCARPLIGDLLPARRKRLAARLALYRPARALQGFGHGFEIGDNGRIFSCRLDCFSPGTSSM